MGESNTGSCRTQTPFSTTASDAQPTEQCVHTVRRTTTVPLPSMLLAPSAAVDFLTSVSCDTARPAPTPRPERRKNARRSIVGTACDKPCRKRCTKEEDTGAPAPAPGFLVSNMSEASRNQSVGTAAGHQTPAVL